MAAGVKRKRAEVRVTRPAKKRTETTRNHRFETFTQRIAKLQIDPVRRAQARLLDDSDLSANASHFKTCLDEWTEKNLSQTFVDFVRAVQPLSDSLAQIVHYRARICDLMIQYLKKRDKEALEPLLDLVSQLAHDLGARFEDHVEEAIRTVADIAATFPDVVVTEWSFNCLAWLFKYLSRLLVPDLRPIYRLIAPIMGRERQKPYVMRFAAEAVSFLVRKAAEKARTDIQPLTRIVECILLDLAEQRGKRTLEPYRDAVVVLLVSALRSAKQGDLHSSAAVLFSQVVKQALEEQDDAVFEVKSDLINEVLVDLIHNVTAHSFAPIYEILLRIDDGVCVESGFSGRNRSLSLRFLSLVAGRRNGECIEDWAPLSTYLRQLVDELELENVSQSGAVRLQVLELLAITHQNSPLSVALSLVTSIEKLLNGPWTKYFVPFCLMDADLGEDRFTTMILPVFQKFIISHWQDHSDELLICCAKFADMGMPTSQRLLLPEPWKEGIMLEFNQIQESTNELEPHRVARLNGLLRLVEITKKDSKLADRLTSKLFLLFENGISSQTSHSPTVRDRFIAGEVFRFLAGKQALQKIGHDGFLRICRSATSFGRMPIYWRSLLEYLRQAPPLALSLEQPNIQSFLHALKVCLTSSSSDLRLTALEILQVILKDASEAEKALLDIAVDIAQTTPTLHTMRELTMYLRRLAIAFVSASSSTWLLHCIPAFCFGLLHVQLTQAWEDTTAALKEMSRTPAAQSVICDIAFEWLGRSGDDAKSEAITLDGNAIGEDTITCGCCARWQSSRASFSRVQQLEHTTELELEKLFKQDHNNVPLQGSMDRAQALRILNQVPALAEKRSRYLVPILLDWAGADGVDEQDEHGEQQDSSDDSDSTMKTITPGERWNRKDQKALLTLFSLFINPKALFRSDDVYHALLGLLCHGDGAIQKSALKALLAWRDPTLRRYEEELMKFLDDSRLKEQMTVFMNIGEGEDSLQEEDRSTVLPIILRLLYGRAIVRGKGEQKAGRRAIFRLLANLHTSEALIFIEIVLGPLSRLKIVEDGKLGIQQLRSEVLDERRQFGVLNMLKDLLETLNTTASPFVSTLVDPVMYCLLRAEDKLRTLQQGIEKDLKIIQTRNIRSLALTCLTMLLRIVPDHRWSPYLSQLADKVVRPRLENFAPENSQDVSVLLRLFAAWASHPNLVPFFEHCRPDTFVKVIECVSFSATKEIVRSFVIREILSPLLDQALEGDVSEPARSLLETHAEQTLSNLALSLKFEMTRDLLETLIRTIVRLAEIASPTSTVLLSTAAFLLTQPAKRVPTRAKSDLLRITLRSIEHVDWSEELFEEIYRPLCSSFAFFPDRDNRLLLCQNMLALAARDQISSEVANLCKDLNSWSSKRLDEPDFETRTGAFYTINEQRYSELSPKDWLLLANNMMHFIADNGELSIRTNATHSLKRCVDAIASASGENRDGLMQTLDKVILNGIERGIKTQPELVRTEYLSVIGYAVSVMHDSSPSLQGMLALLSVDEEASFFNNILHIQQHRRLRALKRLTESAANGEVAANGLAHFIIPLLERFVLEPGDGNLAAESSKSIAAISAWLDWSQFRALLRRYTGMLKGEKNEDEQPENQENIFRLLDGLSITLVTAAEARATKDVDNEAIGEEIKKPQIGEPDAMPTMLSKTLPKGEKLHQYLTITALPPLSTYLHQKEESFVSRRTAIATIATRLLRLLPETEFQFRFTGLLSDVCNILRSKDQGSRDTTRKALTSICLMVGPSSFGFVVKEMKRVLQSGFYLHVLSFSVHSILEAITPSFASGDLDYCVNDIVAIIMEDIFGDVGQEKDAAEYMKDKANKREVRGKKSFDTMQLLARVTSLHHLIDLVQPIESLLLENLNNRMINSIDELLRRIELGLLTNEIVKDRDILIFCYEIIQHAHGVAKGALSVTIDKEKTISHYVVRKIRRLANDGLQPMAKMGKIIRFAFEIIRNVFKKQKELATAANIAGFMPIMGDAVIQDQEEIKLAAIRLFTAIITVPFPRIQQDTPVYIAEAAKIMEQRQGANDEMAQACLKLISTALRERKDVPVKDRTVGILLKRLKPDLQILGQQGSAFTLLRSVIGRKIVIPEVYELIDGEDGVASMSVRDHDRSTRDLARGVYFAFLMNYPQARGRFAKQISFLVRNLQYQHAEGRQSVMETVHLLLNKVGDDLIQQVVKELFWPLVAAMVNDESKQCREMAASLVKSCFSRGDKEWTESFLTLFQKLIQDQTSILQKRTALQCWTLYLEDRGEAAALIDYVVKRLPRLLSAESIDENEWQLVYYALHTLFALCTANSEKAFASGMQNTWQIVRDHLAYPHAWVKSESAKVVGLLLSDCASVPGFNPASATLKTSQGLELGEIEMCRLTYGNLYLLRNAMAEDLASQTIKNLAFLGRCFGANQVIWTSPKQKRDLRGGAALFEGKNEDSADSDQESADEATAKKSEKTAIVHLLSTLAVILNHEPKRRVNDPDSLFIRRSETLIPRISSLRLLALLTNNLSAETISPSIDTILLPLIQLTDPNITVPSSSDPSYTESFNALVTNATELQDMLQNKLGTTEYVAAIQRVRGGMQVKREERRMKRKFEAVTRPEVVERRKVRKGEREKVKRKVKGELARGKRRGW